jgi:hypothetical protein
MKKYLMITDITGKQYPYLIQPDMPIPVENIHVTKDGDYLNQLKEFLETKNTIRVSNRVFKTDHIIEISTQEIPDDAF